MYFQENSGQMYHDQKYYYTDIEIYQRINQIHSHNKTHVHAIYSQQIHCENKPLKLFIPDHICHAKPTK